VTIISKSIYKLPPLETGGVEARKGFGTQDHVGVWYCLGLLMDESLTEVWYENQDDITLIMERDGSTLVEFVQVKSNDLNQLWSIPKLCERKKVAGKPKIGSSILERSLSYDRCSEACCFRIITTSDVNDELKLLNKPRKSAQRMAQIEGLTAIKTNTSGKIGDFKSDNNHDCCFWIDNAEWEVIFSDEAIINKSLLLLDKIIEQRGTTLFQEQKNDLYEKILVRVYNASKEHPNDDLGKKRITRQEFTSWFNDTLDNILNTRDQRDSSPIVKKMSAASISKDSIDMAVDLYRRYRQEILNPQYLRIRDITSMETEVSACLHNLKIKHDIGVFNDNGVEFHNRCIDELDILKQSLPITPSPTHGLLQGCMYNIVKRCLHRFVRVEQ